MKQSILLLLTMNLLFAACGGGVTTPRVPTVVVQPAVMTVSTTATVRAVPATATVVPATPTAVPATATPTATKATNTPRATDMPEPTSTPQPTAATPAFTTFREMGVVDLATACLPFMPNTGQPCYDYLVNGTPRLIDVALHIWGMDLKAQPFYRYFELRFPERPAIWDPILFKTMEELNQSGQRFIFQAPLMRGFSRASGFIGFADIAFDFDKTGHFLGTKILSIPVTAPPFGPDRKIVAKTEAYSVILWEVATRKALKTLKSPDSPLLSLAFSPDGTILAGGTLSGTIKLWDVATGRELKTINGNSLVPSITFSPDGKTLASGGEDGFIRFWEVATGEELKAFHAHKHPVLTVAFSPDGKVLASGSQATWKEGDVEESAVKLWEVATGKELKTPQVAAWVVSVVFSPNGKALAFGGLNSGLWEMATEKWLGGECEGMGIVIISIAFSPDGENLTTVDNFGSICLGDIASGKSRRIVDCRHTWCLGLSIAFSTDGKTLVSDDGRFWDVATGKEIE